MYKIFKRIEIISSFVIMIKRNRKKSISVVLAIILACGILTSCGGKKTSFSLNDFNANENTVKRQYSFMQGSDLEPVQYDEEKLSDFVNQLNGLHSEYGYSELFNYEKAMTGVFADHHVAKHEFSALDENGQLTKEHLLELVRKNNVEYLSGTIAILKDIEDDAFLLRICEIIVETVNDMLTQYPNINKDRVYCNLGNLKIIEKTSALDFAAVEPGMVLHMNRNTTGMTVVTSSNMYNVLVHEVMHILQFGCSCEQVPGCNRRVGFAHSYCASNLEQDYADWTWLAEGSAERMASLYANVEPMTYKTMVNYIATLDLATVLKKDIPACYVETLYFYEDPEMLFNLFDAKTESEREEIYQMIYALEIMQQEPADVKEAYKKIYGDEWSDDIRDEVNNKLKRPIIKTLTKMFYQNLSQAIMSDKVGCNDLLFLVNLFESTIDYHLRFTVADYDDYNKEFNGWYRDFRKMFFDSLTNVSLEDYTAYQVVLSDNQLNATFSWLDTNKQDFLIEKFETAKCDFKFN